MASTGGSTGGILAKGLNRVPRWLIVAMAAISPVATLCTLVLGLKALLGLNGPNWATALAAAVGLILVAAFATVFVQQYLLSHQYARNARTAVALPTIHDALHDLRDAAFSIQEGDAEATYSDILQRSLGHMAMAFSTITGTPCRMCIKELLATADAPAELNFDEETDPRWFTVRTIFRHDGATGGTNDDPTPLHDNTDFRRIWDRNDEAPCFFSNDLDAEPGYTNPHRAGDPHNFQYNAAIVWPIQKRKERGRIHLVGFLCLDALQRHVFQYHNDFDLGAGYADTLYTVLRLRREALRATPEPQGGGTRALIER